MARVLQKHHPLLKAHITRLLKHYGCDICDLLHDHQHELTSRGISEAKLLFYEQYHMTYYAYQQKQKTQGEP